MLCVCVSTIRLAGTARSPWAIQKHFKTIADKKMRTESLNRRILKMADAHPAKKYLRAFIDCKRDCVGLDHDWGGQVPIEQEWRSATDGRVWTFSAFAYSFLSLDIVLDGFLENARNFTASEEFAFQQIPRLRQRMQECAQAAEHDHNRDILELTDQVMTMLSLWEQYLDFRKGMISHAQRNP
jgi:hypothetical protein